MNEDPNRPVVVTTVPTEDMAAMIASRLISTGIETQIAAASGQPGGFQVIVEAFDLERANDLIEDIDHPRGSGHH